MVCGKGYLGKHFGKGHIMNRYIKVFIRRIVVFALTFAISFPIMPRFNAVYAESNVIKSVILDENFETGEISDVFSCTGKISKQNLGGTSWMRVDTFSDGISAAVSKSFDPVEGLKLFVSADFMQIGRKTNENVLMSLLNDNDLPLISIETVDGGIKYKTESSNVVSDVSSAVTGSKYHTLVSDYRINTKYTIAVELDLKNGVADVYVNGDKAASTLAFLNSAASVSRLLMSTKYATGFLADNIQIYTEHGFDGDVKIIGGDKISVPETGSYEYDYTVSLTDTENQPIGGQTVIWSLGTNPAGVELVTDADNGYGCKIVLSSEAPTEGSLVLNVKFDGIVYNGTALEKSKTIGLSKAELSEMKISGPYRVTNPTDEVYKYSADYYDAFGNPVQNKECTFKLEAVDGGVIPDGVSVNSETGVLTVAKEIPFDTSEFFVVTATAKDNPSVKSSMRVNYADQDTYLSDINRLNAVLRHCDNTLKYGKSKNSSLPLLADGLDRKTLTPIYWRVPNDITSSKAGDVVEEYSAQDNIYINYADIPTSNLSTQREIFETFDLMSYLTGDSTYTDFVDESNKWYLDNKISPTGLIYWGGHACVNLDTGETVYASSPRNIHELKSVNPYWESLLRVDKEKTLKIFPAIWQGHVQDWSNLLTNRHAAFDSVSDEQVQGWYNLDEYSEEAMAGKLIQSTNKIGFRLATPDLIMAAVNLYKYSSDEQERTLARTWCGRLIRHFQSVAHPVTGLGGYMNTTAHNAPGHKQLPDDWEQQHAETGINFGRDYEDLFYMQFADDLVNEGYVAPENKDEILEANYQGNPNGVMTFAEFVLYFAETIRSDYPEEADNLIANALKSVAAVSKYQYDKTKQEVHQVLWDGTKLTGFVVKKDVEYDFGSPGTVLKALSPSSYMFPGAIKLYLASEGIDGTEENREEAWQMVRAYARYLNIGEVGISGPGDRVSITCDEITTNLYHVLRGMLELYNVTGNAEYLKAARKIGNNMVETNYLDGFFVDGGASRKNVSLGEHGGSMPLILAALELAIRGESDKMPEAADLPTSGYFHAYVVSDRYYDGERPQSQTGWQQEREDSVNVTGIYPSENYIVLNPGDEKEIGITVEPSDASSKAVTWCSSDSEIADISAETMKIKAYRKGTVTLQAISSDLKATACITVEVK